MSAREEVQEFMDRRIKQVDLMIKRFEEFGNLNDPERLVQHAMNVALINDLKDIKNQLDLTVDWGKDK